MIRGLLRRGADREFMVELTVHRLNNIPVTHRMMFIHWRLSRRDAGSPYYGFTDARPVEPGNSVTWEARIEFTARISSDSADSTGQTLARTPLQLQLRSERRQRLRIGVPSYNPEGVVEIDLAEVAMAGALDQHFLVQDSLLNATLHVSLRMSLKSGVDTFRSATAAAAESLSAASSKATMNTGMNPSSSAPNLLRAHESSRATLGGLSRSGSFRGIPQPALTNYQTSSIRSDAPSLAMVGGGLELDDGERLRVNDDEVYFVPEPHKVQWPVYEQMFYERIRDSWPDYVVDSRREPEKVVDELFARVCQEDGIRAAREYSTTGSESNALRSSVASYR